MGRKSKWNHDEVEAEGSIRAHEPLVTIQAHWWFSPTTKFEGCQGARAELDSTTTTSLAAKRFLKKSCNCSSVVVSTNHVLVVLVVARIRATTSVDWSLPAWSSLVGGKRVDREITGGNNTDTEEIDYDRFRKIDHRFRETDREYCSPGFVFPSPFYSPSQMGGQKDIFIWTQGKNKSSKH